MRRPRKYTRLGGSETILFLLQSAMKNLYPRQQEQGNALWFILIAIVLIAALTFVLTRSSSSINQSSERETRELEMTQILRYGQSLRQTIQNLMMRGCSESQISFENETEVNYANPAAPTDKSCHVFAPEGGGLTWRSFGGSWLTDLNVDTAFSTNILIKGNGTDDPQSGADLTMFVAITPELCQKLNQKFGISTTAADYTAPGVVGWDTRFTGNYGAGFVAPDDGAAALEGHDTGCLRDANDQDVMFQVILQR